MKKLSRISLIFLMSIVLSIPVYAQSAKEAVRSLKRLEAHCQTGITYADFTRALGDAKFEVNLYQESKVASNNIPLADMIKKIMSEYEDAHTVFTEKRPGPYRYLDYNINPPSTNPVIEKIREKSRKKDELEKQYYKQLLVKYPDANKKVEDGGIIDADKSDIGKENPTYGRVINLDYLLPIILRYASTDLNEAMKLLSGE